VRSQLQRTTARVAFYTAGIARDLMPYWLFEARLKALFRRLSEHPGIAANLFDRVRYYNRMSPGWNAAAARPIRSMPLKHHTYYYYDLKIAAKHFGPDRRLRYIFGDVNDVPTEPAIVKSRPVGGDNANSVVMKLDSLRHFYLPTDERRFEDKEPRAVWRGSAGNPVRARLVERFAAHPRHDIGFSGNQFPSLNKRYLSVREQLEYRYVISIEGNDVATNLKWIMASHSLCMMPKPQFETWFMEGRLESGVHYVELRDDFADLEEKVAYYDSNPAEAATIVANANRHVDQFRRADCEQLSSLLVLQKYFECTGQIDPQPFSPLLYSDRT
jgi:hypothetical protein